MNRAQPQPWDPRLLSITQPVMCHPGRSAFGYKRSEDLLLFVHSIHDVSTTHLNFGPHLLPHLSFVHHKHLHMISHQSSILEFGERRAALFSGTRRDP